MADQYIKIRSRKTAKGKSLLFSFFVLAGYLFGVLGKFIGGNVTYAVVFYFVNIIMVSIDIGLYFRNRKLDRARQKSSDNAQ